MRSSDLDFSRSQMELASLGVTAIRILLLERLAGDRMQVCNTVAELVRLYGHHVKSSIVVVRIK